MPIKKVFIANQFGTGKYEFSFSDKKDGIFIKDLIQNEEVFLIREEMISFYEFLSEEINSGDMYDVEEK